jgi:hypothetical protein
MGHKFIFSNILGWDFLVFKIMTILWDRQGFYFQDSQIITTTYWDMNAYHCFLVFKFNDHLMELQGFRLLSFGKMMTNKPSSSSDDQPMEHEHRPSFP